MARAGSAAASSPCGLIWLWSWKMSELQTVDLAIVGAGPAGLAAALAASDQGLSVVIIDEQPEIGGQIFRQPPHSFKAAPSSAFRSYPFGTKLLEQARGDSRICFQLGTTAWGVFEPRDGGRGVELGLSSQDGGLMLRSKALLIATGAHDMPVAFPGWTLPGVMAAGGVQTLLKSQHVLSAKRYVLAGSHPLIFVLAEQLLKAGAEIAEVAIARPFPGLSEMLRAIPALPGQGRVVADLMRSLLALRRHKVPLSFSTSIRRAEGTEEGVARVVLQNVDGNGKLEKGTERTVEGIDGVAIGYGLLASTELARQAGCAVHWAPDRGGWVVGHDDDMQTSRTDIYVAGEPAGIGGARRAFLQGKLAGLTIGAAVKGSDPASKAVRNAKTAVSRTDTFAAIMAQSFAPDLKLLASLADDETILCRCEEVASKDVDAFLKQSPFITSVNAVKLGCRTGMGPCQGRYCQLSVAMRVADRCNLPVETAGQFTAQAPIRPVPLKHLAKLGLD
ncbi:FAD-dependent oxidoreductase [Agrobacterium rubi]|uniref:FAD-dependent oxidoreductase n=2 Tax=Agrobacterium rubi TaxID=28099 RepID=A0AAE7URB1_9HYPH|nr:FAD-dependent oxidoreductase [Agrobacterium rubi]NTF03255.1 FAD-dependent oxidoreductase [Agrobacterium rubi]NTF37415.1 FAD-dependent oxidoreductase [Agrobacterium rubi]QTG02529.1 FAD-dependent oxidoreductase [Agrobacterium rubi]